MTRANVELVQSAVRSVELFWSLLDDDVVLDMRRQPAPGLDGVYVGREAVVRASRQWWGTWTDYSLEAEKIVEAEPDMVLSLCERGRGKGSGIPYERRFAQVWTFSSEGKVVRWEIFPDEAAALAAVGR
jgi:ketosteroid isomerase-like protein